MCTAAIDRDTLNDLFDNQKKLDAVFDSIFDDDSFFISSSSPLSQSENDYSADETDRQFSRDRASVKGAFAKGSQNRYFFVLPILLEIGAIYFVLTSLLQ